MYDFTPLENETIRINGITHSSSVDGTGFRDVLFVNYCPHHCDGCHNPQTWLKENGKIVNLKDVYNDLTESAITNVTFSGGEPFEQCDKLTLLADALTKCAHKTVWIYSGYTYEQIIADENKKKLLEKCVVLVDGKFNKNLTELNLRFKGSTNQRIIDVKKSLAQGRVVLFED